MPRVLIADKLSPAAVDIFKNRGVDFDIKTGLATTRLFVFDTENAIIYIDGTANMATEQLDLKIYRGAELHQRFGFLGPDVKGGSYAPHDGHANPRLAAKFDELDKNKDGKLSRDELPRWKHGRPGGRGGERWAKLDANKDGRISREEAKADPRLAERFDQLDLNKDGYLDKVDRELRMKQHRDAWFAAADTNKDGQLSKAEFDAAMATLRRSEFLPAAAAYTAFLRKHPTSGYTPVALYWLGNAQYAARAYKDAVDSHARLVREFPAHPRTPEAMLAMANSQIELKDTRGARRSLEDLVKAHPQSEAAAAARERLARLR